MANEAHVAALPLEVFLLTMCSLPSLLWARKKKVAQTFQAPL